MRECDEDDCYCHRYPDKDNGDVHKVIDNENEDYIFRCETAIHNNRDIFQCHYCAHWMLGSGLKILNVGRACVMCYGLVSLQELFDTVYPTNCDRISVCPWLAEGITPTLCDVCLKTHPMIGENITIDDTYILIEELNEYPEGKETLFNTIHCKITEELQKKRDAKKLKKTTSQAQKQVQADLYQRSRKRVLSTFIPITRDLSLDCLPTKFARFANEKERAELELLCDNPILNTADSMRILTFISGQ